MKIIVNYDITEHLHHRKLEQAGLLTPEVEVTNRGDIGLVERIKAHLESTDIGCDPYDIDRLNQFLTKKGVLPTQGLFRLDVQYNTIQIVG